MTWSEKNNPQGQEAMGDAYEELGRRIGATVCPVGRVWQQVRKDHPEEELYFTDGEHSSVLGASLAGAVIGRTLLGMDLSPILCFEDAKALETLLPGSPDAGFGCRGRRPKAKASRRPSLNVAFRVVFFNRKLPQGTLLAHPKNPPKRGSFGQIVSIQFATEPLPPAGCPHPRGGRLMARISITSAI